MRINRLRLKNLNSLKGEFCVDLDADSILGRAGVFAITGPIGAGKTTLLDAVCVALYGQTPRLDTGDAGELMTRHTGDCYAEVEFSVNRKKYRSKWSLRKARGKSEGKIQPTVMELVSLNGSEETIIEEQKNKVVSRITELTGLDFSRFTRSMMLAQGNFAAFLNAKDNERADLLEKMTGTEIYSRISSETYARFREEEQILKNMKLLIENIKLMEPEKYKETLDKLKELEENKKKSQIVLNHLDEQKKWLLEIKELEKTIKNSQHEIEEINVEKNERSSDLKRLELGLKAFPHKGKYDVLENHRKQLVSFEKEKEKLERDIPVLEELVEKQDKNRQNEERLFEAFKLKAEKDEEQISNAIVLDQQIIEDQSDLKKKSEFLVSLQNDLLETRKRMKSVDDSITSTGDKIKQLETFLIEHDIDSPLEQKLPLMNDRVTQLEARRVKLAELSELLTKNKNESALIQKDHEKIIKATKTAEDKVTFIAEQQKAVEELLKNELGGRAPDEWEKDEKHLEKLIVERDKLIQLSNQFFE
ncbi:AAA family ATPase, partial [bacterium]|nr:AAA family ATPase [bacterium]